MLEIHPLLILFIGIATVLGMIVVMRINAFIALITAALVVSILAPGEWALKVSRVAEAFGSTAGAIGIVIALAAVIGKAMMDSGAADRVVQLFLKMLGEKRTGAAMMGSGFTLSIPVFFDTAFYLLAAVAAGPVALPQHEETLPQIPDGHRRRRRDHPHTRAADAGAAVHRQPTGRGSGNDDSDGHRDRSASGGGGACVCAVARWAHADRDAPLRG